MMRSHNLGISPYPCQALIDLHTGVVVLSRQTEVITGPDDNALRLLLGREKLSDHLTDVLGTRRRPDGDAEGVEAVAEEALGVGSLDEMRGAALGRAEEQSAIEVEDDEDLPGFGEPRRCTKTLRDVQGRRVGNPP